MKSNWTGYALSLLVLFAAAPAAAQNYPNKSVRLIVPIAPGGQTDLLARFVARESRFNRNLAAFVCGERAWNRLHKSRQFALKITNTLFIKIL